MKQVYRVESERYSSVVFSAVFIWKVIGVNKTCWSRLTNEPSLHREINGEQLLNCQIMTQALIIECITVHYDVDDKFVAEMPYSSYFSDNQFNTSVS